MVHPVSGDQYTEKYMAGGKALASARMRMPGWFHWMMLACVITVLFTGVMVGLTSLAGGAAMLALVPVELAVWFLFSHVRTTVTEQLVHIQLGLFGPKIPIEAITKVEVEKYDWKKYGGWGIKRSRDGTWAYSVPGGKGEALRVEYRDDKGKERKVVVSADNAAELVEAINRQRASSGVRIDESVSQEAMAEADAFAEEAAALAAEEAEAVEREGKAS